LNEALEDLLQRNLRGVARRIFAILRKHGVCPQGNLV
jgi:hypothetical protein